MKLVYGLALVLLNIAAMGVPSNFLVAASKPSVYQIAVVPKGDINRSAREITVFIQGLNNAQNFGSGVIIGKAGNTYTVLTAYHVVAVSDRYTVSTNDSFQYPLKNIQRLANVDLAIAQFESTTTYPVAQLGNSEQVQPLDTVYVAGYPKPGKNILVPQYTITEGEVTSVMQQRASLDGYGVAYSNLTRAGMSGGPVLNDQGQVIAIHGRAEGEPEGGVTQKPWVNLGIPISRYQSSLSAGSGDRLLATVPKLQEQARVETERKAQEQAKLEAERKAQEQAKLEAERKAQEQAKLEAERKAQAQARLEAERKAQEQARLEAERKAQEQARLEAERKAQEQAKLEAERKAQEQTRLEAERKAQEQARLETEHKAKLEAERKAQEKAKLEAERKEAERKVQEQARLEAERKTQEQAKLEAERKAQEQAKLEAERQNRQTTLQAALPKPDPLSGIRPYEVALSSQFSPPKRQSCRRVRINTIVARVCDGDSADEGASDTAPPTNTPEFYVKRGNERSALGNIRQGIDDYTQAIALNPDYATAYFNRGYYRYKAGEIDQARSDFAKAISLFESQGKLTEVEKVKAILSKI
jgi:hypothetical protein